MRRAVATILLSLFVLSFSELHQLFKFPVLIEHFREHRSQDPGIGFFDFLKLHYSGIFIIDDDYQRDNQLPFRTADCLSTTVNFDFPPQVEWHPQTESESPQYSITNVEHIPTYHPSDIFQPPRTA